MAKKIEEQWDVPSESKPDKTYKVTSYDNGVWACGCPRWIFHREECKHIQDVQDGLYDGHEHPEYQIVPANVRQTTQIEVKDNTIQIGVPLIPFNKHSTQFILTIMYDLLGMDVPYKQVKDYFKKMMQKVPSKKDVSFWIMRDGRCVHKEWIDGKGWTGYEYIRL